MTTAKLTEDYIRTHPCIKACMVNGLINYSALARKIGKELGIQKQSSMEAILIASRRFKEKLYDEGFEKKITHLFQESTFQIINKIFVLHLEKSVYPSALIEVEKNLKKQHELFIAIEGVKSVTIIAQEKSRKTIDNAVKHLVVEESSALSAIFINSPGIEVTVGAIAYLTALFLENGVNIVELMSCWNDTLIVVQNKDVPKAVGFLNF